MALDRSGEFFAAAASAVASRGGGGHAAVGVGAAAAAAAGASSSERAALLGAGAAAAGGYHHGAAAAAAAARPAPSSSSTFMAAASELGGDLQAAAFKIGALTKLVKRRGMYSDPGEEIERLTGAVKDDMASLSARLDVLQEYVAARRSKAAAVGLTPGKTMKGPRAAGGEEDDAVATVQGINHSDAIVGAMRGTLMGFTRSLRTILEVRTESLKSQAGRRQAFGTARELGRPLAALPPALADMPPPPPTTFDAPSPGGDGLHRRPGHSSAAAARHAALFGGGGGGAESGGGGGGGGGGLFPVGASAASAAAAGAAGAITPGGSTAAATTADAFAQLSMAQLRPDMDNTYLESRARDMVAVERHIAELSTMFGRLAHVVSEQGSLVERIEDNVDAAGRDLEAGVTELERWKGRVFSNSRLALRITGVLLFVIFILVFFGT